MIFLVAGYGAIGKRHESILRSMGHSVMTLDPDLEAGAGCQTLAATGQVQVGWDGILICTPPDVRRIFDYDVCRAYFVEKPVGDFETHGAAVQVGFCYRFSPTLPDYVNIIKKHQVYHLTIVGGQHLQRWHKQDYRTRSYWGVTLDSLPHSLYIARWILGDLELVGNVASKLSGLEIDVDDVSAALLRNDVGVPCVLLADYLRDPRTFYIETVTSRGVYRWEFAVKEVVPMYRKQMETFVRLCQGEDVERPTLEDGRAVQVLLDQMKGEG